MHWLYESIDRLHVSLVSCLRPPVLQQGEVSLADHLAAGDLDFSLGGW